MKKIKKTIKNKIVAMVFLIVGLLSVLIEGDITALVLFGIIAIPLFFAKENYIN